MTMAKALESTGIGGAIFLVVAFAMFFVLSVIILIIMEGVSAMVSFLVVILDVCVCKSFANDYV